MIRLKELRIGRGWRQSDLAKILNTNAQTVSRYERGDRGIDLETLITLCEIFDCSADYLLGRSDLPSAQLSEEEQALLLAYRRADARATEMVRLALQPFLDG